MPDEGDQPRPGPIRGDESDQTQRFDPPGDEPTRVEGGAEPAGRPPAGDQTAPDESAEPTRPLPPAGSPTQSLPGSPTQPLPGAPGPPPGVPAGGTENPRWSGRAGVPPPAPPGTRPPAPQEWGNQEWDDGDERSDRRWWMPILLGILALILLAALSLGVWLIVRSQERDRTPSPSPSVSGPASTSAVPTTSEPTSPAPTSPAPTSGEPSASATSAAPVTVPPLVGLPRQTATLLLDQLGLTYRLQFRPSNQPAGTVIGSQPTEGSQVPSGTLITLIIAEPPSAPPTTASAAPTRTAGSPTPTTR